MYSHILDVCRKHVYICTNMYVYVYTYYLYIHLHTNMYINTHTKYVHIYTHTRSCAEKSDRFKNNEGRENENVLPTLPDPSLMI